MAEHCFLVRNVEAAWSNDPGSPPFTANGPEHLNDYRVRFPSAHGFEGTHAGDWFNVYLHTPCPACDAMGDWLAVQPFVTEIKL